MRRSCLLVALLAASLAVLASACDDAPAAVEATDEGSATVRPELLGEHDRVLLLGDSLTVGADQFGDVERRLRRAGFDEVEILAEEGRDTSWAIEEIDAFEQVPPLVVVELGTNPDADPEGFADLVAQLVGELRARGAQRIAWLTPVHARDDRYEEKVEILLAEEGIDVVADWASVVRDDPRRLAADGFHPSPEGYEDLAGFLVDTVGDLAR